MFFLLFLHDDRRIGSRIRIRNTGQKDLLSYHENGHVVRAGGQTALVEPLAAPHTVDHGPVPHSRPAAVAVHILQNMK
jgi:hypothetical protein